MTIKELALVVFLLNLPFGYLRSLAAPLSVRWLLAVHLPVPVIFLLRSFSGLGWGVVPLLVLADVAGQLAGGKIREFRLRNGKKSLCK